MNQNMQYNQPNMQYNQPYMQYNQQQGQGYAQPQQGNNLYPPQEQQMMYKPQNHNPQQMYPPTQNANPVDSPIYSDQQKKSRPKQQKYTVDNENQGYNAYAGSSIFSDDVTRRGFIKKVLSIIGLQMFVTTLFVLAAVFVEGYQKFVRQNQWLLILCIIINFITLIALYCFRSVCKEVPKNYILLGLYTLAESYLLSCLCSVVTPGIVLMAFCILTALVGSLVVYALYTKTDITLKINFFIYAPIALIVIIIVASAFNSYIVQTIVSLLIIGFFSAYLVFDIQRLTNPNKNAFTYTVDDYIIAALDIYIDIIMIFKELILMLAR